MHLRCLEFTETQKKYFLTAARKRLLRVINQHHYQTNFRTSKECILTTSVAHTALHKTNTPYYDSTV